MLNKRDREYRKFLAIRKRLDEIYKLKRQLPWRKLDKPEHAGWTITFTLTPEGMRRPEAPKWLLIMEHCDKGYSLGKSRGALISKIRENKKFEDMRHLFVWRSWDGTKIYSGPHLNILTENEYKKLPEILQRWRFFHRSERETVIRWGGATHTIVSYHHQIPDHLLSVKVRKRMYTHAQDVNPVLEREEAFLDDKMEEYWRKEPGRGRRRRWEWDLHGQIRKHTRDAIIHLRNGEITDVMQYHKLGKQKA